MKSFLAVLLLACLGSSALAQSPQMPYTYAPTVGTGSLQVIGSNPARKRIEFYNPNDTAKVAVCPTIGRASSSAITCAVNGAGSITLLPYQSYRVDGTGQIPQVSSAWNGVASAGSSALTIFEWE